MSAWHSIVLGIVQGLTEFLPVSSSGHLVIAQKIFGLEPDLGFIVLMHLGTLLAVLAYFRKDIIDLVRGFFSGLMTMADEHPRAVYHSNTSFKLSCFLVLGTASTAVIALLFKDIFEGFFSSSLWVGFFLLVTGCVLVLAELAGRGGRFPPQMNFLDSILIGAAQGLAIAPGLSRAGATISAALALNLERKFAARFSFLLAIPAILGAGLLEMRSFSCSADLPVMMLGMISSFISGYLAIKFFMYVISRTSLRFFACYCFIVGALSITLSLL